MKITQERIGEMSGLAFTLVSLTISSGFNYEEGKAIFETVAVLMDHVNSTPDASDEDLATLAEATLIGKLNCEGSQTQ